MPLLDQKIEPPPYKNKIESMVESTVVESRQVLMERLQREFLDSIWRYVFSRCDSDVATVEDVVAETYSAAWAALAKGEQPKEPWPWLVGIARRKIADLWRSRGRKTLEQSWWRLPLAERERIEAHLCGSPGELHLSVWAKDLLREALSGLRPEMQELLMAHHVDDIPIKELSRRSGKSISAIESALVRARAKLRQAFFRKKGQEK